MSRRRGKGPVVGRYIPLPERIAFKIRTAKKRREWLEHRHATSPRCHYCKNLTDLMPPDYGMTDKACAGSMHATLDHRIPLAKGGRDKPDNWCLACYTCNSLKADMPERDYKAMLREEGLID